MTTSTYGARPPTLSYERRDDGREVVSAHWLADGRMQRADHPPLDAAAASALRVERGADGRWRWV